MIELDAGLQDFRWNDYIYTIASKIWDLYGLNRAQPILAAYHEYSHQLHYLKIIWNRLKEHVSSIRKIRDRDIKRLIEQGDWSGNRQLTDEEAVEYLEKEHHLTLFELDYDSFIIHGYMLMDRLTYLAQLLIPLVTDKKIPKNENIKAEFFDQLQDAEKNPEKYKKLGQEAYAQLLKRNSQWYLRLLKDPRDKLIVHSKSLPSVVGIGRTIVVDKSVIDRTPIRERDFLEKLRKKYVKRHSELGLLKTDRVLDIIKCMDWFRGNISILDRQDKVMFISKFGAPLPNLNELAQKLISFSQDFADYFFGTIISQYTDVS